MAYKSNYHRVMEHFFGEVNSRSQFTLPDGMPKTSRDMSPKKVKPADLRRGTYPTTAFAVRASDIPRKLR